MAASEDESSCLVSRLPGDFRKTKKPKARETVTWLPNQWVAAVG